MYDPNGDRRIELEFATVDYDAEHPGNDAASADVWMNYGSARVYSNFGVVVEPGRESSPFTLRTRDREAPRERLAFAIYRMGHENLVDNTVDFTPTSTGYAIDWTGSVTDRSGEAGVGFRAQLSEVLSPEQRAALPAALLPPSPLLSLVAAQNYQAFHEGLVEHQVTPEVVLAVVQATEIDVMKRFVRILKSAGKWPRDLKVLSFVRDPASREWLAKQLQSGRSS